MISQVDAIFENGLLRPLASLPLSERERVTLTIATGESAHFAIPNEQWEAFHRALDAPAKVIPNLQALLTEPGAFDGHGAAS